MAKVEVRCDWSDEDRVYLIYCPGCKYHHAFDKRWTFSGTLDKPTFSPSMFVNPESDSKKCHSFVRDGQWQFLNDSHHEFAGKTVDIIDIDSPINP